MSLPNVCLYLAIITFNCAEVGLTFCSLNPKDTVNFQQYLRDLWKSSLLFLHSTASSGITFLFFLYMQNSLHLVYFNLNPNIFWYLIFSNVCLLAQWHAWSSDISGFAGHRAIRRCCNPLQNILNAKNCIHSPLLFLLHLSSNIQISFSYFRFYFL
jgi:hypothetical protein